MPGLLAGLALRYDASRAVDMNGRAQAAGAAMNRALGLLKVLAGLLCQWSVLHRADSDHHGSQYPTRPRPT